MITLSIDEKDPHVLRVTASYLLALASTPILTAEIANEVAEIHNGIIDQQHGAAGPAFNPAEIAEAEQIYGDLNNGRKGPPHPTGVDFAAALAKANEPDAAVIFGGKPNVAPSTVAVAPLPIAPGVTMETSSIPTPPNVPVPPVASAPSKALTVALPTATHAVDVDARGLPWDSRIHSREKTKVLNGNWKNKRGVESALVAQVEAELAALMAIPSPVAVAVPTPPPLAPAEVATPPVSTPVVPAPPATIAPPVNLSSEPFPALIQKVTAAIASKTLNNTQVINIVKSQGLNALPDLVPRPDLIPGINAAIDAQITANIASGVAV